MTRITSYNVCYTKLLRWFNPADGAYSITAQGGGFTYSTVHFNVTPEDALAGIALYIATPPDAIISSDDSGYIPVAE